MYKRFLALDGIRGYAAFAVLFYHAILIYDPSLIKRVLNAPIQTVPGVYDKVVKIVLAVFDGRTAVLIFFILSGLVLSIALRKSIIRSQFLLSLEFSLKRIARIYPTLIVSLLLFWASRVLLHQLNPNLFSMYSLRNLIDNATLMAPAINGPTWTLQVEILAIPFILICFAVQNKFGFKGLMVILFFLLLTLDNQALRISIIPMFLYQSLPPFVCGFMIATEQAENFFKMIGKDSRFLIVTLCCLFLAHLIARPVSISSIVVQLFSASIFLGIIYYRQVNPLLEILESRPSVYLGKISYSFYLNNGMFLYIFAPVFFAYYPNVAMHPLEAGFFTTLVCVIPAIVLSHITEKYVEQPSIKIGKLITNLFSSVEKKHLTPVIAPLNVDVSLHNDLQNIRSEGWEAQKEKE